MAGMLALTLTRISHIQVFGFMSALGVGMAFLFTIYLLPAMLDLWAPSSRKPGPATVPGNATGSVRHRAVLATLNRFVPDASRILQRLLDKVLPIVEKNPYAVILTFAALFGFCIYGATQVKIDSNMVEQFKEGTSIRETYEIVDQYMMGTQNMEVFVDMGVENGLKDPRVLKTIENLQREFERKYGRLVVRTYSLADVVKDAYRVLNEDREAYEVVPDDARILDQTLFLFNNANPEDRRRLVSDDYRKSHVSIQLYNEGSYEYNKIFAGMKRDIHWSFAPLKDAYPEMDISVTGGLPLMMELGDYISYTQLKSLGMAIGVISVMLIFVFGSIRAGLLSIVPNLIPATLTFGLLGIVGIALDMDTLVIAPVIIGIAVDDTIHFITHYREEVLETGDVRKALRNTIKEVGQAITFTSLILGLGFSVMSFSNHMGTMNMGIFGTMAVFAAVLCDLFLLSALILVFKPRFLTKEQKLAEKAKRAEA
ncbi:MAG: MMPL family transporter, partial [Proteobacteria bacterium]|nr:MMPL family transporter [Pseudomonadota bacterium]